MGIGYGLDKVKVGLAGYGCLHGLAFLNRQPASSCQLPIRN